ncbi:MAG: hypothetical protein QW555_07865 [Nitrososphaerota archaeon]
MSQVVYTELEGFPLRWEYKGAVPQETKKEADRTAKTWSVSTTPAAQVANTNTGTGNVIYGPNTVAQSFKSPGNATKAMAVQLYGNKVGSPPNPLYVEVRKVARNLKNTSNTESTDELIPRRGAICTAAQTVTVNWTTTGDKTLMTLTDTLPAGRKLVIFVVGWSGDSFASGYLKIIAGSTTLVQEGITRGINSGNCRLQPVMIFALHDNAPPSAQYSLVATITTAGTASTIIHVQGMVVWLGGSNAFFTTGSNTSIGANTTVTLARLNTNFAAGSKVVVLAYILMGVTSTTEYARTYSAGNIRILRGSTIVSQTQFQTTTNKNTEPAVVALAYFDSSANANQSYAIQVYNNLSETSRAWGVIVAFQVSDGAFLDTGSVSLTSGSQVTVGDLSTTLSGDVGVVALATAYYSGSNPITAFYTGDVVLQKNNATTGQVANQWNWELGPSGRSGVYALLLYDKNVSNPSYQVKMTARQSSLSGEAKIVVFKLSKPSSAYISLTFNRHVAEIRLKIRRINNPSDITAKIYVSDVLMKTITLTNISTSYDIYTVSTGLEIEYTDDFKIELSYTAATTDDDYALKLAAGQPANITVNKVADVILYFPNIKYYDPEPSETVLASGSIAAASVGTAAGWINIPLSTPIVLRPSTYYNIVVYTIGGDASNYYAIHNGGAGGTPGGGAEIFMSSTDSGSTWVMNNNTDLSFQLMGVQYTQIYSGTISNNVKHPLGGVILQLSIKAQTSGSMEFAAFDDYTLTAPIVSSTSTSQTEVIILKPTDQRIRDAIEAPQVSWSIWAAGSGLSTRAYTQRYVYMTKNPIYPADFGFSELYLVMDELPPKAHVALNDNVVAGLYNSSETMTRLDSYELFRIPVRKAEVIAEPTSGKIVLYFIGLV